MKKVSVCASYTYYYDVEVPDELCELDDRGLLIHEAKFANFVTNADPTSISGSDDVTGDICSIRDAETDYEYLVCY